MSEKPFPSLLKSRDFSLVFDASFVTPVTDRNRIKCLLKGQMQTLTLVQGTKSFMLILVEAQLKGNGKELVGSLFAQWCVNLWRY